MGDLILVRAMQCSAAELSYLCNLGIVPGAVKARVAHGKYQRSCLCWVIPADRVADLKALLDMPMRERRKLARALKHRCEEKIVLHIASPGPEADARAAEAWELHRGGYERENRGRGQ